MRFNADEIKGFPRAWIRSFLGKENKLEKNIIYNMGEIEANFLRDCSLVKI